MKEKIGLSLPHMSGEEQKYIQEAFESNYLAPLGHNIDAFENEIQSILGTAKQIVALNSGTSAIHLALMLAGVKPGDEVLCQSFTFAASAFPILYQKAIPVFIDSERETWNICPELLEKTIKDRISKGKKPSVIIVVQSYGFPAKMDEIKAIIEPYNILLIEDSAGALGSSYKNKKCGTLGDFGVLSFNGNKIITTSGGGALICNSKEDKKRAVEIATQAKKKFPYYMHAQVGYNYRISNVLAGIGRGQLEVLDDRVRKRRLNFEFYKDELLEIEELVFQEEPIGFYTNRWLTCFLAPTFEIKEQIRLALKKEQIESRSLWNPLHLQPVFKNYPYYTNGVSEQLFKRGICVPSSSSLTNDELFRVANCIKNVFKVCS